ncbi:MAG: lipoyl synthase [candidate division Zixibacteria bacterium SM23_73_3]|nr:MAG: lipoyl synthase [candidate division Zixibacteria bacterium SM23_73_3]
MQVKRPEWLKVRTSWGENYRRIKSLLARSNLHSVCQEANCPNISHCFEQGTATFLILGDVCTRGCKFCDVKRGIPLPVDEDEPKRLAEATRELKLQYVVVTSVTRDDLPDGGAVIFSRTVKEVKRFIPNCKVEVLIPDFAGSFESLKVVLEAEPDVLNHNMETIKRLYPMVRKGADYQRSLDLLLNAKKIDKSIITKSGIMLGLGEAWDEIIDLMNDLKNTGCKLLTIGQYLSPSEDHLHVAKFYHPDEFAELKVIGKKMGFAHVESGPLVRSSYHAQEQVEYIKTYHEV